MRTHLAFSPGTAKSKKLAKREAALNMLKQLGHLKFNEDSKGGAKRSVVNESLAQLEDCFMPEKIDSEKDSKVWRSEEKKAKLQKDIETRNNLDLTVEPYLNSYQVEITPVDVESVLANVDSQLPNVNYIHEIDKYLNMNGIKYVLAVESSTTHSNSFDEDSPQVSGNVWCSLTINFSQKMTFIKQSSTAEEAKHSVAREALIHLIKQQKYKEFSFPQLNRLLPERTIRK